MTLEKFAYLQELIIESVETGRPVSTAYIYKHAITGRKLFAAFLAGQADDIYESEYVLAPVLIYVNGEWQGEFAYLNG